MKQNNDFKNRIKYTNPDQIKVYEKISSLIDSYEQANSKENREFLCYLSAAIFLTYKKLFPQLSIYISFRTKSDLSFIKNIQKEFSGYISDINSNEEWDLFGTVKDLSAFRIILNDINYSIPPTKELEQLYNDKDIKKLLKVTTSNSNLINKVNKYLVAPIHTRKKYVELKYEILKKLSNITPPEFTDERKPYASFHKLYEEFTPYYNEYLSNPDIFSIKVSDAELTELHNLLDDLRSRQYDQLHFELLRKTLPIVLQDPLITNALQTSYEFCKERYKPNGFQACYYNLPTPFGIAELQTLSNKAYYASVKGSAYHSGEAGKNIDVRDYFELVDPNDKHSLSYYLDILDSVSADSLVSPYELPNFKTKKEKNAFLKTPKGIAFLESEKYREMIKHIKIKDNMQLLPQSLPKEAYDSNNPKKIDSKKLNKLVNSGEIQLKTVNTNEYLLSTALSLSPYMNICSAGHTSFTTASIHHKKVIGAFAEILRSKDSNTCLRDLLIRRLEGIIETYRPMFNDLDNLDISEQMRSCLKIVKRHNELANILPKDISTKNIISYAEKLRDIQKKRKNECDLDQVI